MNFQNVCNQTGRSIYMIFVRLIVFFRSISFQNVYELWKLIGINIVNIWSKNGNLRKLVCLYVGSPWQLILIYLLLTRYFIWFSIVHSTSFTIFCFCFLEMHLPMGIFLARSSHSLVFFFPPPSLFGGTKTFFKFHFLPISYLKEKLPQAFMQIGVKGEWF